MKLSLTPEADSVNVQALNMGRIVVDIDGVNLAELINKAAENGDSLRVVDDRDSTETPATYASPHQLPEDNTVIQSVMPLTTETALDILIAWLQDNIDCGSGLFSTTMRIKRIRQHCCPVLNRPGRISVPCTNCNLCTRTGESHSPDSILLTPA
ncbi:hypothetical protein KYE034_30810 [Escherichia coli]